MATILLANTWNIGLFLLASPFGAIALLFLLMGRYYQSKYHRLGESVLIPDNNLILQGQNSLGWVELERVGGNRVNSLTLTCLRQSNYSSGSESSTRYDVLWQTEVDIDVRHLPEQTQLQFELTIPMQYPPTYRNWFKGSQVRWQLSFEFVEAMVGIKRTWDIPVVRSLLTN